MDDNDYLKFNDASRAAARDAERTAWTMQSGYIGTEHWLLGLLNDQSSVAVQAMSNLGVTSADIRAELKRRLDDQDNNKET